MGKQRKYLDRGRKIELEGRPYEVDWVTLLGAGRAAVQRGRADETAFLSEVMWEGVDSSVVTPRPAALDYPLMRRWLDLNEQEAIDYLCDGWGYALYQPKPETADQARALLDRPRCATKERWQHFMYSVELKVKDGPLEWYAGYCNDCQWAMLMLDDDLAKQPRWWPFYDQESE